MKNSHGIILDDYYELWTIFDWVETTINNRDACIVYPIETICQVRIGLQPFTVNFSASPNFGKVLALIFVKKNYARKKRGSDFLGMESHWILEDLRDTFML